MIHQGRYIIDAFLICLSLAVFIFFINLLSNIDLNNKEQGSTKSIDVNISKPSNVNERGKDLFIKQCASCHNVFRDMTGPALAGFTERGPWKDKEKIYNWINNPAKFMATDEYTNSLMKRFGTIMTAFPALTKVDIDAIVEYINQVSGTNQPMAYK